MEVQRKNSKKRQAILESLRSVTDHPTAEMIYNRLKPEYPDLSLGTVYRNLAMFLEEGQIISVGTVDGQERYDARTDFHAHLVCRRCRCVTDIEPTDEVKTICEALARQLRLQARTASASATPACAETVSQANKSALLRNQ